MAFIFLLLQDFYKTFTIDASQLCFEPLVIKNQDNFEFQFSATQLLVKRSRPKVLLLLSLYRDREQLFKDTM